MPPNTPIGLHDLQHVARLRRIAKFARQQVLSMRMLPMYEQYRPGVTAEQAVWAISATANIWWDDLPVDGDTYAIADWNRGPYDVLRVAYVARAVAREYDRQAGHGPAPR